MRVTGGHLGILDPLVPRLEVVVVVAVEEPVVGVVMIHLLLLPVGVVGRESNQRAAETKQESSRSVLREFEI